MGRRAPVLALALVIALTGCSGESGSATAAGGTVVELAPGDRKPAPALSGDLLDGGRFELTGTRGQVVVVNFWASWCAPCRVEAADLEAVYQATKAKGVAFLGINIRDDKDKAKSFHSGRATFPSLFDPAGRLALEFQDVPPNTIPATLVIDRSGKVAAVIRTSVRQSDLQPIVERIAADG